MPTDARQKVIINIAGGWATDYGPSYTGSPNGNALSLPFLLNADNVTYELDGGPHKVGGATRMNTTQVTEAAAAQTVWGMYDFWKQGTAGAESQKIVANIGTKLLSSSLGDFTSIKTGLESGKEPAFEVFTDLLIWTSTSLVDVPQKWNQVTATTSDLGGTPPKFSFHVKHRNRLWASGNAAVPSRLYYSENLDPETWSGGASGSIDIDPSDGDRIVGLASHKNELFIFKGPNKLSIHRITGSSPTGSDAFARTTFVNGVGGVNHNSIFRINDDLVFADTRGLHSLAATAAYGNYVEAFLSRPILSYYQDSLNHSVLNTSWGVNYQAKGLAVWLFAKSGGTAKNVYLVYDYRFQPGRWMSWSKDSTYYAGNCLSIMSDATRRHRMYAGGTDGYVNQLDVAARAVNTTGAYTADVLFPFLNFGSSAHLKTVGDIWASFLPKGASTFTLGFTRDTATEQSVSISQSGGDTLG